ncbi:tyrosine-type recombinase/integrase [Amycolatopsis tolypomycina]|uniref:tyrosine-type recombinase/integrase n=1 Tax=Amycolatopsis tolypomycina TaxID=208445 RepID=UPI0033A24D67
MAAAYDLGTPLAMDDLRELLPDFKRHLRAKNRSPDTIDSYVDIATEYIQFLIAEGLSTAAPASTHKEIELFFSAMRDRKNKRTGKPLSEAYIAKFYRSLQQFFVWMHLKEEVIPADPFAKTSPPTVNEVPPPVLTVDQIQKLLDTTKGKKTFEGLRDRALMLLFLDTPGRIDEIASTEVDDRANDKPGSFDFDADVVHVLGKGRRPRAMPFGAVTGEALRRYLRARARHPFAAKTNAMWLGRKGALTDWGIRHVFNRRAAEAGLPHIHPHMFRHTFAHRWLEKGGQEQDLMRLAGWKSRQMVGRYGASAATERAHKAHRRSGMMDEIR